MVVGDEKLTEIDELLWRFDDLAFLPHVFADDRHAAETPILLSTKLPQLTGDVLVLLDDALPADWQKEFGRFSRIIDVVSTEPTELKLSRDRWRAYKAAGWNSLPMTAANNPLPTHLKDFTHEPSGTCYRFTVS